jgi:hypothetical protein
MTGKELWLPLDAGAHRISEGLKEMILQSKHGSARQFQKDLAIRIKLAEYPVRISHISVLQNKD